MGEVVIFLGELTGNATFAVLVAAGLGYFLYKRQKNIDLKFQNNSKLIFAASSILKECQNTLFILDRINYTTEVALKNSQLTQVEKREELKEIMKSKIAELSKCINDKVPRASLEMEHISEIHFSHHKDVQEKVKLLLGELKKWHDDIFNSTKLFNFKGEKAKNIFPINTLSENVKSLIKFVS